MKRFQLVDGAIRHGDLMLAARLHGEDRARAHAELLLCADPSSRANGKAPELDRRFAAILRQDPSLLLETIPTRYPLNRTQSQTWANADPVWKNTSTWFGTWVRKALELDCDLAVAVALEHGIHPDDADVWPEGALLATDHWSTTPSRLELALRHGAKPDRDVEDWSDGYLYKTLGAIRLNIGARSGAVHEKELLDGVKCAHMLLNAGVKVLGPPVADSVPAGRLNLAAKLMTSIGLLCDGNGLLMQQEGVRAAVFDLAERLQRAGADIDRRNGISELPPVVQALRCLNIEFACHLVRMGCKTDDASIVRANGVGGGAILPLMDEAQKAGGDAFRTQLLAATMERQVLAGNAARACANEDRASPVARRRRMGAI